MNDLKSGGRTRRLLMHGCLLAATVGAAPCFAQSIAHAAGEDRPTAGPLDALRRFEPAAGDEYRLGPGDEITIDVGAHPELGGKRTVGPDGRITLPMAGSLRVSDRTREEAAADMLAALSRFYSNLSVTVGVDKYLSNRVLLLGAVEHPGVMLFDTRPTLLEVVTRGGVLSGIQPTAELRRPLIPERCIIYRGSDKAMFVDLKGLLDSGSPLADLRLRRDDIVYVPSTADRFVSVLGQVQHPGAFQLENATTLQKLLAEAGGLTDAAGDNPPIRIISPTNGTTRTIPLRALLQPKASDLSLKPGDILFIPKSGFNKVAYDLEKLSPLISIFTAFAFLEQ